MRSLAEASTIPVIYETNGDGSPAPERDYRAEINAWLPIPSPRARG